ncbi:MAG: histidine kinase dimerization/phosphoacceptor domain -containing protein [Sphingomonas sp.]|uniref:sensor histidine kinase n=1 Tax=Sphingomonas sp. TaxID=28214 RepID=UPI0035652235
MEFHRSITHSAGTSLGLALVTSSTTPLLLLDEELVVRAASGSFCAAFDLDPGTVVGATLPELGTGEWGGRQLCSLLRATMAGEAAVAGHDMDLVRLGRDTRQLVVAAHLLDYAGSDARIAIAIQDVTDARRIEKQKDDVLREKQVLMQELQHRVANSLQIIASVLMQSARKVQSDEARAHISDAHLRVMSIATLQRQLAATQAGAVALRPYFTDLCSSIGASMIFDHDALTLQAIVDDSVAPSEVSVSLGLIVTELVINALKHAFREPGRTGAITVEYWSRPTGWRLTVEDNGAGMPSDPADARPGLGTGIVDALARQLDASVIVTGLNPGTRVAIIHTGAPVATV